VFFWLVDDQLKCEAWLRDDAEKPRDSEKSWWLHSFMGTSGKDNLDWEYPFAEGRLFILNLRAGIEGFHLTVDGRHVSSFPYHSVKLLSFSGSFLSMCKVFVLYKMP
jgi:hypothetical protein